MNVPIVLIHGLWLTPRSWQGWKAPGAPGWEPVADYALDWADRHVVTPVEKFPAEGLTFAASRA